MFSICFQSDQDLFTDAWTKNEMSTHSSHAKSKTKATGQLVSVADYVGESLEVSDKHKMHMYIKYMNNILTCAMTKLQAYKQV